MLSSLSTQQTGQQAEQLAYHYLVKQGLKLITRNFRCKTGEIDLIMRDRTELVFIEVRFRSTIIHGDSLDSITISKQQRLIRTAQYYLQQQLLSETTPCRFDAVGVNQQNTQVTIKWIKNAFTT